MKANQRRVRNRTRVAKDSDDEDYVSGNGEVAADDDGKTIFSFHHVYLLG